MNIDSQGAAGRRIGPARRFIRSIAAVIVTFGLVLAGAGSAAAEGATVKTGHAGTAHVLAFGGGYERTPRNNYELYAASVKCMNNSIAHQAVVAGAYAWAYNAHPGAHNDWQYVRMAVVAQDLQTGTTYLGAMSGTAKAWDNTPARFGSHNIYLARGHTYTIYVAFFYYNSKGKLAGSRITTPQTGAWAVSVTTKPYGEYWFVQKRSTIPC